MDESGGGIAFAALLATVLLIIGLIVGSIIFFSGSGDKTAESADSPWSISTAPTGQCFLVYRMSQPNQGYVGALYMPVKEVPC